MKTQRGKVTIGDEWPKVWLPHEPAELGTAHLPSEVVAQHLTIGIWLTTDEDNPRSGLGTAAVIIGGRSNPKLTEDELVYIRGALTYAFERLQRMGREEPE